MTPQTDLAIARATRLQPLTDIAGKLAIPPSALLPFGHDMAKIAMAFVTEAMARPAGKLVLVTAVNPTPAGEGKTTTTIGLGDDLAALGHRTAVCLREASMGPCFGLKGGATGGGRAQIAPMEEINLHFTGDMHAVTSAHNLAAAMLDNHLHQGNALAIDPARVTWPRVLDMNDRALREVVVGLGGATNGQPRQSSFDITVASEVMAILCLANDRTDLERRLADIVLGATTTGGAVTVRDLKAAGAMTALLRTAIQPNLVQTLSGTPALVHGGPFANIAHGCNSVLATRTALGLAEFTVTEAGFGADLGAEKFLDIKCRKAGLAPDACVLVATVRALKMHGGVARAHLAQVDPDAVTRGAGNLVRHLENLRGFGLPTIVAVNHFAGDDPAELAAIEAAVAAVGGEVVVCRHWADGAAGAAELARRVVEITYAGTAAFTPLYPDSMPLAEKIETVARQIYRAGRVVLPERLRARLSAWEAAGHGELPVCMAKTPYSFSGDPSLRGAPEGFDLPITDVRLSAGAGFVVALCGAVLTMPGLPRHPAAEAIGLDANGRIDGLF